MSSSDTTGFMPTLVELSAHHRAGRPVAVLAGGTDFYPALGDAAPPADIVDVTSIDGLRGVRRGSAADTGDDGAKETGMDAGTIGIGAATTWADLLRADLPSAFDALRAAAREVGSVQIQARATLGGNLCTASPAADGVPPLLALDARVVVASVRGQREIALGDWLLGPRRTALAVDELLIEIRVPTPAPGTVSRFAKLGARRYLVISIAMLAVNLRADRDGRAVDTRIAVGACSPVAVRLPVLEAALDGCALYDTRALERALDAALARDGEPQGGALATLAPIDDVRASAGYRRDAVATLLRRLVPALARDALVARGTA